MSLFSPAIWGRTHYFADPVGATEIAYANPVPLVPTQLGGDWSTYWYNGFIYE